MLKVPTRARARAADGLRQCRNVPRVLVWRVHSLEQRNLLRYPPIAGYLVVVPAKTTMDRIGEVAAGQWGLITRRQAEAAGVPDTTLERLTAPGGVLSRVAFGVYLLTAAPTPDHVDLRAAWLQLEPAVPR